MPKPRTEPSQKEKRAVGATKPPGPRLTRDRIAEEALRLIDERGLEELSMRALGAALGVEAMALYHHFENKGQLLDAVATLLLAETHVPGPEAGNPFDRIEAALRSYRALSISHPRAFMLLTTRRYATATAFAHYERQLEPFFAAGFDAAMAARLFRLGGYFAGGAGHAEIASRAAQRDATPVALERFADAESFPLVGRVAPHLKLDNLDAIFEFGLAAIMDIMRNAPRSVKPPSRRRAAPRR